MDPYAIKNDNKRKFKDKQMAKQRHATPSDRKYRTLKRQQQVQENDEEPPSQPSNEYRYLEDVTLVHAQQQSEERDAYANRRVKEVLKSKQCPSLDENPREHFSETRPAGLTRKDLERMNVADLNRVLGRSQTPQLIGPINESPEPHQSAEESLRTGGKDKAPGRSPSMIPADLEIEQDFLDGII